MKWTTTFDKLLLTPKLLFIWMESITIAQTSLRQTSIRTRKTPLSKCQSLHILLLKVQHLNFARTYLINVHTCYCNHGYSKETENHLLHNFSFYLHLFGLYSFYSVRYKINKFNLIVSLHCVPCTPSRLHDNSSPPPNKQS